MTVSVALCVDGQSMQNAELLGLDGENLASQTWLKVFSLGQEMRDWLTAHSDVHEAWIVSCEDITPINLAATLKADNTHLRVYLITCDEITGSFATRLRTAGLDEPLSQQMFLRRYACCKQKYQVRQSLSSLDSSALVQVETETLPALHESKYQQTKCSQAFVMPVVSGSGGSGKSTISVVLAYAAQLMGYKTLLIDLDLQFGDIARLSGMSDAFSIDDVLDDNGLIERLKPQEFVPAVLAAPHRLEDSERVVEAIPQLLSELSQRFDVVIANTGAFWGEQHALLLERATRVMFLVDQRPSSMWACQHALDLCARCGIASGSFVFAANKCTKRAMFSSVDVSCVLGGAYAVELADGGKDVEELVGAGFPAELFEGGNALCASAERVLKDLLPNAHESKLLLRVPKRKNRFFLKRKDTGEGDMS